MLARNGFIVRAADDWMCLLQDEAGRWYSYWTECDPLWNELPPRYSRFALGLGSGTGNRDTEQNRRDAAACIMAIGLRKLELGHPPDKVDVGHWRDLTREYVR